MIEKLVKSALLALVLSGCGAYSMPEAKPRISEYKPIPQVIQRTSVFFTYDQTKELNQDNFAWTFEYRVMF
ncbi:hypothetical protein KY312_04360 [Candidatus Woesearchaeota archaeon]|nr:hypothetical protein [Candidatus Woesearchaeota archaeon]